MDRLRDAVFPIYGSQEITKFLALAGIQFFIIFVLTLTRDLKDTLIITSCGAEAISFLKVWGVSCAWLRLRAMDLVATVAAENP